MPFFDPYGNLSTPANPLYIAGATVIQHTEVAAGTTADTVIKAAPGKFYGFLVTTLGLGVPHIYDNASAGSGAIIGACAASLGVGLGPFFEGGITCSNGITVGGGLTNPAMTVFWS